MLPREIIQPTPVRLIEKSKKNEMPERGEF